MCLLELPVFDLLHGTFTFILYALARHINCIAMYPFMRLLLACLYVQVHPTAVALYMLTRQSSTGVFICCARGAGALLPRIGPRRPMSRKLAGKECK